MTERSLFLALLWCLLAFGADALTWQQAYELSRQNSHELKSAEKQLEATDWSYRRSFSPFLPNLSGNASVSEGGSGTTGGSGQSYSYGLTASQSIFRGMDEHYGVRSAYANLEYQKAAYRAAQAAFFYDLRAAFLEVLIGQENLILQEKILKQRQDNARLIQLRYDSGKEDRGNLLATGADEAKAGYDLAAAKRELELARLRLSRLLQREVAAVEEQGALAAPAAVDLDQLISATPSYVMARYQLESAELAKEATISGFLPSLSLSGSYRKSGSEWPPDSSSKSWSLSLSYPLFPGGTNFADRLIQEAKFAQAKEDFASAVNKLEYSLRGAYDAYQNAVELLRVNQLSLDAAAERARISRVKYLNGLTVYDEWDRIEGTYIQAQKSLLNYKRSALLAEANWHKIYGGWVK